MTAYKEKTGFTFCKRVGNTQTGSFYICIVQLQNGHVITVSNEDIINTKVEITIKSERYNPFIKELKPNEVFGVTIHGTDYGLPFHIKLQRDHNDNRIFETVLDEDIYW